MPATDMATSLLSFDRNEYGLSLKPSPFGTIQQASLSCFGLPNFNMAARKGFSRR